MNREKGFGYCGLACCICSHNADCPGCREEGCAGKDWCKPFRCCKEKNLGGCWECALFPCDDPMLAKLRVRTFAKFIAEFGEDRLADALARNEKDGMVYHYPGKLVGDYDKAQTEEELFRLLAGKAG